MKLMTLPLYLLRAIFNSIKDVYLYNKMAEETSKGFDIQAARQRAIDRLRADNERSINEWIREANEAENTTTAQPPPGA